ncbi:MAG TPA: IS1595 family transposase [Candidatus Binataceae bacterium]|nr:IS1595 family transposase [Candidatus Binataceae bacterium]
MTFQEFMATFLDEAACRTYLTMRRWPDGPRCPRCDNTKVYECGPTRPFHWQCMKCGPAKRTPYRFSVTVGTVFENTNVPLVTWFKVLYTILQSKKGVSSRQLRRTFFGERSSLYTAWYVGHRLRAGMKDEDFKKLMGIVEVDETFIGGKDKNRHWDKKSHVTGGIGSGKVGVIGAISRKGNVVCQIIENTDAKTLNRFVHKTVSDRVSLVATEDIAAMTICKRRVDCRTKAVKHSENEYVRGEVHTNNIESFWALFKRGVIGTYHNVSKKYLPLYLNEFQFRHNNRKNPDIFGEAIAGC